MPSETGFPLISLTMKDTAEDSIWPDPFIPITCGTAETNWMFPVAAGLIVTVMVLVTVPATIDIVTAPVLLPAVKVIVAVPVPPDVEEVEFDNDP